MAKTFQDALGIVLREERGFVCDPHDSGGMTCLGVTAANWRAWTGKPATEAIMRALTPAMVSPFYQDLYWRKVGGDTLPIALALVLFDFGVNAGPARAVKMMQGICGASKDGAMGPATQGAVQAYGISIGWAKLIAKFCDARRDYYRELDGFLHFGKGWLARVDRVEKDALSWV